MSDTLGLHEPIHTDTITPTQTTERTGSQLILKMCIIILLVLLAAECLIYLFIIPFTSKAKLQFSGNDTISEAELKYAAGLTGTETWGRFNTALVLRRLASYPLIAEAKVIKKYPDKVIIELTERKPVGVLFAAVGGRTVSMEIDKTGTVFKIASNESYRTLPVISGLLFQNIRAGMKVHKQLVPLFRQLDILQKKNPALLSEISEIKIEQKKYGGFDLILYPVQMQIKVRTDSTLNADRLQYMMLVLDVIRELDLHSKIEELDVRAGTASYRLRGETDE